MVQLNVFETQPIIGYSSSNTILGQMSLIINGVEIPGSLSFNNVGVLLTRPSGASTDNLSVYFGLYSRNGSTLSLANSASNTLSNTTNFRSWLTLVTSATQNITPGNWYFAFMSSSNTNGGSIRIAQLLGGVVTAVRTGFPYAGIFVRGYLSVSTAAMPASIATTDLIKETDGVIGGLRQPYILISA